MRENNIVEKNDMTLSVDLVDLKNVKDKDPKYLEPSGFFFTDNIKRKYSHNQYTIKLSKETIIFYGISFLHHSLD